MAFALARRISLEDGGRTWGRELCGPILFADGNTNEVVANQADLEGQLEAADGVWRGRLPKSIHVANTAIEWSGVRWTMVAWPLPATLRDRATLLGHECYHRIQPELKLPANDVTNTHLDGKDGRIWMLLEWRALERALAEYGKRRKTAIQDAVRFRQYRRSLISNAAENEDRLEMNEGLAEYTGIRLANSNDADCRAAAIFALRIGEGRPSLVRSFAYASGPAYGTLLDESGVAWRKTLTSTSDFGIILANAYGVKVKAIDEASVMSAGRRYGGDAVISAEIWRAQKIEEKLTAMRARFIAGPLLILPMLGKFSFGFDPNGLTPLDDNSIVYRPLRASDLWGVLEATSGMIVRENGSIKRVVVPAPNNANGSRVTGDGWKLDLNPDFKIANGVRAGDLIVEKK